jgi:putative tricarboxylic transport membrane protein
VGSAPIDLWMMLAFGAVGYFMTRLNYPVAPLVLAMVLGDRTEDAFRQSMILSHGSLAVFWSNPLAGTIISVALLCFAVPGITALWRLARR